MKEELFELQAYALEGELTQEIQKLRFNPVVNLIKKHRKKVTGDKVLSTIKKEIRKGL